MNGIRKALRGLAGTALAASSALAIVAVSQAPAIASPYSDGCSGGLFCGWDDRDAEGRMVAQYGDECVQHDIGLAGRGDRITSYWNHTGRTVKLYNWAGNSWQELATIPNGGRGELPTTADNKTDMVQIIC